MKEKVDLTENQIFSRRTLRELHALFVISAMEDKFPWESNIFTDVSSDDELDLGHQKKSLIALGNKKQRAEIAEFRKMDSGNYCDCCGRKMRIKPWIGEVGLCQKCNESFVDGFRGKYPWSKEVIGIAERRVSVFDMS